MCGELEDSFGCKVKIAIAGKINAPRTFNRDYIHIFIIRKKFLRILTYLMFGYLKFFYTYLTYRPQIVILDLHSIWFSIPFSFLARKKIKFIVDNRTPFYNAASNNAAGVKDKLMKFYTKLSYWYCKNFLDGMTVITSYYKRQVCKDFNFAESKIDVWGSGVNIDVFSHQKYAHSERPVFLKDKFVIMQHGEISRNRGLFETIESLNLLKNRDICLLLIGDATAGSTTKDEAISLVKKLYLENSVYILPPVPHLEIPKYISYCDCAIMAYPDIEYWNNNNPIKLIEYLAMGKVVICTNMWTFRDVIEDKKCGHYIPDNNPESITSAIHYCYENRASLAEWGKEGIGIVEKRFTWQKQAERLYKFVK